ncbi:hypothetical protein R1538_34730 [Rhizobium leguminosarum]|uniref:hypothetical protein n=1 Tax=Rhizobium leguminosarum TaxID=384 RepID=UPI00293DFF39|nr:hypothetical protein [Rhizobium leguminosarum]MDV4166208.1 hypothetical protein [Rhizobium leguminosarum]
MRFVNEVALRHTGDECLIWPFAKAGKGYGHLCIGGKPVYVHRYICELVHGAPPTPEHEAAHSCGRGHLGCIAHGHLGWKTHIDNIADKIIHGTHNRGERAFGAKLTEADVREIISLKGVEPQNKLAKRFMVSKATISLINSGRNWGWISEEAKGAEA